MANTPKARLATAVLNVSKFSENTDFAAQIAGIDSNANAVPMIEASPRAQRRVNSPIKISPPPINSVRATSHAARTGCGALCALR